MPDFGYAQQRPEDSSSDLSATASIVRAMMAQMDTMKLVQVTAVHGGAGAIAAAGTVDVTPLVNQIDGNGNPVQHGVINGIPWSRIQGGSSAVICDPEVGDIGWVVAADRDTSSVRAIRKRANPGSRRQFDIADGVYAGGCLNVTPNQFLVFTATGCRLVDKNGNSIAMTTSGLSATDSNGNTIAMTVAGMTLTDKNANQIQMKPGIVNVVTLSFQVNGTPVTVP